jgi:hypothetical protein
MHWETHYFRQIRPLQGVLHVIVVRQIGLVCVGTPSTAEDALAAVTAGPRTAIVSRRPSWQASYVVNLN